METEMHILLALEDTGESRAIADKLVATHGLRLDAVFCRDDVFKCINDIYYSIIIADDSLFYSGDITRIIREAHTGGLYVPETEIILLSKTLTKSVVMGDDEPVFMFRSPASAEFLFAMIGKIRELQLYRLKEAARRRESADEIISALFNSVGLKSCMAGTKYIREAVHLSMHKPKMLDSVTKLLYPAVAKESGISAGAVERQIRKAISECLAHGDIDFIRAVFGIGQDRDFSHITSARFVSCLSSIVSARTELKEL